MELSIVLALIGIVSTMVVSFTVLTSTRVWSLVDEKDCYDEIYYVETIVSNWVSNFDDSETYTMNNRVASNVIYATNKSTGIPYYFSFDNSSKTISAARTGGTFSYPCKYITGMKIVSDDLSISDSSLVTFTFTYKSSSKEDAETKKVSFCKALRTIKVTKTA